MDDKVEMGDCIEVVEFNLKCEIYLVRDVESVGT